MERTFTYSKPSNFFDTSSAMEDITCNYVGPARILLVVDENGVWSIEEIPAKNDDVWGDINLEPYPDDFLIPESTDRYVVLDATNDNHVPLMQYIAGEEVTTKSSIAIEDIGTFTHSDGTTFVLKYEDAHDSVDPIGTLDEEATIISDDGSVNYAFAFLACTDETIIEAVNENIKTSSERKIAAETAELKKLWGKHIAVLNWIASDIIGTVPAYKIVIPNVVDVELGATFAERDL